MTDPAPAAPTPPSAAAVPAERLVTTGHRLRIGDRELAITATCGLLVLREDSEKDGVREAARARAGMFFVAYTLDGAAPAERPVTFAFNGGPGSSSVWLHLGLLGPKRVRLDEQGVAPAPPYGLEDNPESLLSDSDLVLVDPVGTGFSRMAEGEKLAEFHDYQRDLDAVGEFIRMYLARWGRWGSPKYLIGESYGTTRAAGLSRHLQDRHDLYLNGLMLISLAIDMQTLSFDHANDLPSPLFLPTYAATAWYHGALEPALQDLPLTQVIARAEAFANTDYLLALMQGSRLPEAERQRVAAQVAHFSGLDAAFVMRCDLRPSDARFAKELLRRRGWTIGRMDSRFLGRDRDDAGEEAEQDAAHRNLAGAFASGINTLLRDTLGYETDERYVVLAPIWDRWAWKDHANKYVNVGASLSTAMQTNPHLRVYVASGWYDLATPHAAGDYTIAHLGLRPEHQRSIRVRYFEAGHMMYIHRPSLLRLADDLRRFVRGE